MEPKRFRALLRWTIALPLLAMAVLAGVLLWEAYDLSSAMKSVDHTDQVISSSRRVLGHLLDMETGLRGYLLTGNDAFLKPYQNAQQIFDSEFDGLYRLVADNPPQQARLQHIRPSYAEWQQYAERMIALRRSGGSYSSSEINLPGKRQMDALRDQITEFRNVEDQIRDQRTRAAQSRWWTIEFSAIGLIIVIGSFVAFFTRRQMRALASEFQRSLDIATARTTELAASEQRWATTLASIGDAVMATDASGNITFLNPLAESLLECPLRQCIGKPADEVFRLINEETGETVESPVGRAIRLNRIIELGNHVVLLGNQGTRTPLSDSAAPIRDAAGNLAGAVLVFRDVSERRARERERAEALLREQVARRMAEESASRLRKIESVTEAALTHLPLDEMLPRLLRRTMDALQADMALILLLNEKTQMLEVRAAIGLKQEVRENIHIPVGHGIAGVIAQTGQVRIVDDVGQADTFSPYLRESSASLLGAPLIVEGRVIGVIHVDSEKPRKFTDEEAALLQVVAERIALAVDRKRAEEALLKSKELLETFVREAPVALAMFDRNMRYLQASERWLLETGLAGKEILGKSHYEVLPDIPAHWKEQHRRGLQGESIKFEEDWVATDGKTHHIQSEIHPWGDAGAETGGIIISFLDLTELKQAEQELRNSEERLSVALQAADLGTWDWDIVRNVLVWSDRCLALFGVPPGTRMSYRRFLEAVHREDREQVDHTMRAAVEGHHDYDVELRTIWPDGSLHWVSSRGRASYDESGQPVRMSGAAMDITGRKQAQQRIAHLASFPELNPTVIFETDLEGKLTYVNPLARRQFPTLQEAGVKHALMKEWPFIIASLRSGPSGTLLREIEADGVVLLQALYYSPELGVIRAYCVDITARQQAEAELLASEERWATTLQSIGDAVISTCAKGKIVFMNAVAESLTGWKLAEVQGEDLRLVFNIVQEATRIRPENPVEKVIRSGKVVGLANHTLLIRRNGLELPIEDSASPIRDREGRTQGIVLVFHDVGEQRKMEKALRESERLATTGRLAATIAHEIHNPLDAVGNLLYLAKNSPLEPARQYLATATEELQRVTQMTQQMLTFQRDSAKPVPVLISTILENVLALYHRKIESSGIQVTLQVDNPPSMLAQPGEMRQVFANLVGNAIEAMGRERGQITIRACSSSDWRNGRRGLRVTVADTGHGIPHEVRDRIFEPFFTTKGESGTGLGLWVITGIISKYQGTIRVKSSTRAGRSGTVFSVFIPVQ